MKIEPVNFLISIAIGGLISYGLWSIAGNLASFIAIGSLIFLCGTLVVALGVKHENARTRMNLSSLSVLAFIVGLGLNLLFCFVDAWPVVYVLVTSISFLLYLLTVNFIANARQ